MKQQFALFLTALAFLTRIPCSRWADHTPQALNQAARYFPLVGIVVGTWSALIYSLALLLWPASIAVLMSMAGSIWLTGAFHEDGLADSLDGLGGGWQREDVLRIMSDSRLGSYGAIGLVLALLAKYQALNQMQADQVVLSLLAGHALSRLAAVLVIASQHYVKSTGKTKPLAETINPGGLLVAIASGLLPLIALPTHYALALLPVAAVWIYFSALLRRLLGGYTGDCLGAMQQLTEIAFYLGIVACKSI